MDKRAHHNELFHNNLDSKNGQNGLTSNGYLSVKVNLDIFAFVANQRDGDNHQTVTSMQIGSNPIICIFNIRDRQVVAHYHLTCLLPLVTKTIKSTLPTTSRLILGNDLGYMNNHVI